MIKINPGTCKINFPNILIFFISTLLVGLLPILITSCGIGGVNQRQLKNNLAITVHEPQTKWNPTSASDADLTLYNYPARPKDDVLALKAWQHAVSGKWVKPDFKQNQSITRTGLRTSAHISATNTGAYNWSGLVSNKTYTRVVGSWTQPSVQANQAHRPAFASNWIGLGGFNSNVLIQTGTDSFVNQNGSSEYYAWFEIVGSSQDTGSEIMLNGFRNKPGDLFYSEVWFTENQGIGTAHFYISDTTSGYSTSFQVDNMTGYQGVDQSADWIVERPEVNGVLPNLANYDKALFYNVRAGSLTSLNNPQDSSPSTIYISMYTDQSQQNYTLSIPSKIDNNGNFSTIWQNYY